MKFRYLKSASIYLIGWGLIMNCLQDILFYDHEHGRDGDDGAVGEAVQPCGQ